MDDDLENVSDTWRPHVLEPRRAGRLDAADAMQATARNAACGDVLVLHGAWRDDRLTLRFQARGCWAVAACASACCERLEGAERDTVERFAAQDLVEELGGLPRPRRHVVGMFQRALDELVRSRP